MATKTVLNEFVAYLNLAALPADALSPRSAMILTYALCGFANFGSLGIMVGGIGAMVPERRAGDRGAGPALDRVGHDGDLHAAGRWRGCCWRRGQGRRQRCALLCGRLLLWSSGTVRNGWRNGFVKDAPVQNIGRSPPLLSGHDVITLLYEQNWGQTT